MPGVKGGKSTQMDNASSTSGCYSSNNGSSASSNEIGNGRRTSSHRTTQHTSLAHSRSPNKIAQRGPAAGAAGGLEGESGAELWGLENEQPQPENEYSTGHYNSTLRSSTSRHRKVAKNSTYKNK